MNMDLKASILNRLKEQTGHVGFYFKNLTTAISCCQCYQASCLDVYCQMVQ